MSKNYAQATVSAKLYRAMEKELHTVKTQLNAALQQKSKELERQIKQDALRERKQKSLDKYVNQFATEPQKLQKGKCTKEIKYGLTSLGKIQARSISLQIALKGKK